MARCEGVIDEYACLNCKRPECLFENQEMEYEGKEYKKHYYELHREELLRKQREYDKTHPRRHRRRKKK